MALLSPIASATLLGLAAALLVVAAITLRKLRSQRTRIAELEAAHAIHVAQMEEIAHAIGHDLRAPLRHAAGFAQIVHDRHLAPTDARGLEHLERVRKAVERADAMASDVARIVRLGLRPLAIADVDLGAIARASTEPLAERYRAIGARVEIGALPAVRGDAAQLRDLFAILLENSAVFHDGAPLVVSIEATASAIGVTVHVHDNGRGIDPANAEYVFRLFHRAAKPDEAGGRGVGLAIARRIVAAHGGRIWATPREPVGTTISFFLPPSKPLSPALGSSRR